MHQVRSPGHRAQHAQGLADPSNGPHARDRVPSSGRYNPTLVNSLLLILQAKRVEVLLAAPTGRAAKRLTEIFRQAVSSRIIVNAHRINRGEIPLAPPKGESSDLYLIEADDPEDIAAKLYASVTTRIPRGFGFDPVGDIQVLAPMNPGGLGVQAINVELQRLLNPDAEPRVQKFGTTYAPGDKVLRRGNNDDKEVFNGDIGRIMAIDPEQSTLTVTFDGRAVEYDFGDLDELALAYADSIHKSQGSEYPVVVILLAMQRYQLLERNLLYTAVTRGRKLVVIISEPKALRMAVKRQESQRRITRLAER
jgi:exodeoxyribonuclease V alpha subunit